MSENSSVQPNVDKIIKSIHRTASKQDSNFVEAAIDYAEKHDLEIETIAAIIRRHPSLKTKVRVDAEKMKMVAKKHSRLPV